MLSRRQFLSASLLAAAPAAWAQENAASQANTVIQKDYIDVRPPVNYPARPILVHDFFAYTCPHCLTFAPDMEALAAEIEKDPDVQYMPVPVAWNTDLDLFPRAYYIFASLGILGKVHMPFWEWVIRDSHDKWDTVERIEKDVAAWVRDNAGIAADRWASLNRGFAIVNQARRATRTWKSYGVDSTPSVGIAGLYLSAPHLSGTRRKCIAKVKELIETVRQANS